MAQELKPAKAASPAQQALDDAIELAIDGQSPYPDRATFVDANDAQLGKVIRRAIDDGRAIVLAYPDGVTRVLRADVAVSR